MNRSLRADSGGICRGERTRSGSPEGVLNQRLESSCHDLCHLDDVLEVLQVPAARIRGFPVFRTTASECASDMDSVTSWAFPWDVAKSILGRYSHNVAMFPTSAFVAGLLSRVSASMVLTVLDRLRSSPHDPQGGRAARRFYCRKA